LTLSADVLEQLGTEYGVRAAEHTKYWVAALGARAGACADALHTGTVLADEHVDRLRRQPRRPESVACAAALENNQADFRGATEGMHG
jgi:hypothetical protein